MLRIVTILEGTEFRDAVNRQLSQLGAEIYPCKHDYGAFLKRVGHSPQLVLIELYRGTPDELVLIDLIRQNSRCETIPIILVGPAISAEHERSILKQGASAYLAHPFSMKRLLRLINDELRTYYESQRHEMGINVNQLSRDDEIKVLNSKVSSETRLAVLKKHVGKLLAFPGTVVRVLSVSNDEESGADDLAAVIESDPAATTEVIKLANSVQYAARGRRIASVKEAIVRIGFQQTKVAILSMSMLTALGEGNNETGFSYRKFWEHSLTTAVIAEILASRSNGAIDESEAFLFGLMQGLGLLLLNEYCNALFLTFQEKARELGFTITLFQREAIGITHNDLMAQLVKGWGFPELFATLFEELNDEELSYIRCRTAPLATTVLVARNVANAMGVGSSVEAPLFPIDEDILDELHFNDSSDDSFFNDVHNAIELLKPLFPGYTAAKDLHINHEEEGELKPIYHLWAPGYDGWNPVVFKLKEAGYEVLAHHEQATIVNEIQDGEVVLVPHLRMTDRSLVEWLEQEKVPAVVFDVDDVLGGEIEPGRMLISTYPIDERDIVPLMNSLHDRNYQSIATGRLRTLLPVEKAKKSAIVVHPQKRLRVMMEQVLKQGGVEDFISLDDTAELIPKIEDCDADFIVMDLALTAPIIRKAIIAIKQQKHHKRARYILTFLGTEPPESDKEILKHLGVYKMVAMDNGEELVKALS